MDNRYAILLEVRKQDLLQERKRYARAAEAKKRQRINQTIEKLEKEIQSLERLAQEAK